MTLHEQIEMWTILNPQIDFWNEVVVPEVIDKSELIDYLLYEYGEMETLDNHSGHFKNHVTNFFKIHKWNIDKLCATLKFEYNPLEDTKWHQWSDTQDDKITDFASERDIDTNEVSHKTEDDEWSEQDTIDSTKVNYVSAFNMDLSPSDNKFNDSEHHRDTEHSDIDKKGDDYKTTDETINTTTDDDVTSREVMDNDIHNDTSRHGNGRNTFQSLIEEERKQALFNIYKWIGKHFSTELLICIW